MKQMYKSLALLALSMALPGQIQAWANNTSPFVQPTKEEKSVSESRNGLFEIDYLFWKPYQEDLNFGLRMKSSTSGNGSTLLISEKPKSPNFELSSGVRVGFGGYTADAWDIRVKGTYLYSDTKKEVNASGVNSNDVIFPSYLPISEGKDGTSLSNYWRLNFGLIDVTMGRETALSRKFAIHPFIGIRTVWIRETVKGTFQGLLSENVNSTPVTVGINPSYKHTNNVWGMGPRAGLGMNYFLSRDWSILGGVSGAFVLGNFRTNQTAQFSSSNLTPSNRKIKAQDSQNLIRANMDGYFGLSWDRWVNNNKNRVYVALLCETSYWFGINQFMDIDFSQVGTVATNNSVVAEKRHGDLAMFGGTVHFQLDF